MTTLNGCGWKRPKNTVSQDERALYNCGILTADTQYCHHFAEDGRHLVLHGLPSSMARQCHGVIYLKIGFTGKKLMCGEQRSGGPDNGHDKCTVERCAFLAEGLQCPFI